MEIYDVTLAECAIEWAGPEGYLSLNHSLN